MSKAKPRPVFLNLLQISLPPAGIVSFLHRISGLLLVLCAPIFIYLFALSLHSAEGFAAVLSIMDGFFFKLMLVAACWSFAHHAFAGIRFLLLDVDIGINREKINQTAWWVMVGGVVLGLILFMRWL